MQARRSAFTASLLLGVLWGAWHLPLRIAQGLPLTAAGLAVFLLTVLLITAWAVLFTWVYNNANSSLFLMVLLHAVIDIAGPMIQPGNWIGSALLLILTWATVALVVTKAGAARLSRSSSMAPAEDGDRRLTALLPIPPPARQLSRDRLGEVTDPS
jgi:hypothetical protein